MVSRIDNATAVVLGALTFIVATIGINIVANFVSPAFDFSNVAPSKISWRAGGMIAAVTSIFITPLESVQQPGGDPLYTYTLDILGSFIGPLFGILIVDYYLIKQQRIVLDDMFAGRPVLV
jgi:NCS1 family nucleobase:cation symporter-1